MTKIISIEEKVARDKIHSIMNSIVEDLNKYKTDKKDPVEYIIGLGRKGTYELFGGLWITHKNHRFKICSMVCCSSDEKERHINIYSDMYKVLITYLIFTLPHKLTIPGGDIVCDSATMFDIINGEEIEDYEV